MTGLVFGVEARVTESRAAPGGLAEREVAFKSLIGPRLDRAYGLAWHLLADRSDAEDACQEAVLAAWSAWPQLRDPARFEVWFDRILVNRCTEHLRRRSRRRQTVLDDAPEPVEPDPLAGWVDEGAVADALARLSVEHRIVVVLRFWADLSTDAIALRLDVPPGTVRSRLHYALVALRKDLAREAGHG